MTRNIVIAITIVLQLLAVGCGSSGDADSSKTQDAIVVIDGKALTRQRLNSEIPSGLSPEDSTSIAKAFIRSWIDTQLMAHFAGGEINMEEIDRLVDEYRTELIASRYRMAMSRQATDGVFSEDSLKAYYDAHPKDFILERPMVKGVYLKVPNDAPNLKTIRKIYSSDKPVDIDRLDKAALSTAIHYDYFRDRWVDWEQIETRIPYDFPGGSSVFLQSDKPLEVQSLGFTYLLYISEYLPAGKRMPFEAARSAIRERLLTRSRKAYDSNLRADLYERALADSIVRFPGANPLEN